MTESATARRLVILISGRGSNMQAIVDAIRHNGWPAEVCAVITHRANSEGMQWAQQQGIATHYINHTEYESREHFDAVLQETIDGYGPDYVLLAGFMRVLTPGFVRHYMGRLINVHPSLLPLFPGLHTHQQALDAGVQWHGCTVHFVTPELDSGPTIAQGIVPVEAGDDAQQLAERLLPVEHKVYIEVVRWLIEGRVQCLDDGRVQVAGVTSRGFI
ncbi:phosphoribosylglycinamide formyltransferase [Paenalcaligenes suwonensis]|uniref:phosphoribosylglycinamide formyltransferase n=1 Tax=Paenalcaligenes suwonensis TaxID=1202713 RepID=UPI00140954DF|nr:phosphoribosylglycinamide formyltransferase [Paenalcaligenes suwonensis]NHC61084.1 phosphoribosylglycinamide formyltransferase [Paenalcaligenes suwonensis]